MPTYLTLDEWRIRSAFGPEVVLEHIQRVDASMGLPLGTHARFETWEGDACAKVDDTLRRRYAVPFASTNGIVDITKVPRSVKVWIWMLLDCKLLDARREAGVSSPDDSKIAAFETSAMAEMEKCANANEKPNPELPLRSDLPESSGISKGGPMVAFNNTIYGYFDDEQSNRDSGGW
jgi:hypothetical protein